MAYTHLVTELIEANKKIQQISNKIENENQAAFDKQSCIDDLNNVIRKLDHIVEHLEADNP